MKALLASLLIAAAPALALAQAPAPKPAAKPAARPATKPAAKPAPKLAPSAQKAVEEKTEIDDDPSVTLSPADLEIAKKIHTGTIPCELGANVIVTASKRREGFFTIITRGHRFLMHPVESRTGAIRLEDPKGGAMWLQLGNKSMLMSQKLGQRLADDCQNPDQAAIDQDLKKNPAPSLLEPQPSGPN